MKKYRAKINNDGDIAIQIKWLFFWKTIKIIYIYRSGIFDYENYVNEAKDYIMRQINIEKALKEL